MLDTIGHLLGTLLADCDRLELSYHRERDTCHAIWTPRNAATGFGEHKDPLRALQLARADAEQRVVRPAVVVDTGRESAEYST